jgi:hypothetical protein
VSRRKTARKKARSTTAEVRGRVAPVATEARDAAVIAAGTAREWAAPRWETAAESARELAAPYVKSVRSWAAPRVDEASEKVREDVVPRVAAAVAAALAATEPAREQAASRGSAAMAALRGDVAPPPPPPAKRYRVSRRIGKVLVLLGLLGAAAAGWRAYQEESGGRRQGPEPWLPPAPPRPTTPDAPATVTHIGAGEGGTTLTTPGAGAGAAGAAAAAAGTGAAAGVGAAAPTGVPATHPPTDDTGGASPDEALADETAEQPERLGTPLADEAEDAVDEGRKP